MQIVLTDKEIAAMPADLRRDLLSQLLSAGELASGAGRARDEQDRVVLGEAQAFALLRHVSFGRRHRPLHDLLRVLAEEGTAAAPLSQLSLDEEQLRRRLQVLDRLVQLVTHDRKARLVAAAPEGGYALHPRTRALLRDIFARLGRSGEREEALWE